MLDLAKHYATLLSEIYNVKMVSIEETVNSKYCIFYYSVDSHENSFVFNSFNDFFYIEQEFHKSLSNFLVRIRVEENSRLQVGIELASIYCTLLEKELKTTIHVLSIHDTYEYTIKAFISAEKYIKFNMDISLSYYEIKNMLLLSLRRAQLEDNDYDE